MRQLIEARCKKRAPAAKTNAGIMACLQSRDAPAAAATPGREGSEWRAATSETEGEKTKMNSSRLLATGGRLQRRITKYGTRQVSEHKRAAESGYSAGKRATNVSDCSGLSELREQSHFLWIL